VVGLPEQAAGRLLARYLTVVRTHRFDQAAKADEQWRILLDHLRSEDGTCYLKPADSDLYGRVLDQVDTGRAFDLEGWLQGHSLLERYDRLAGMVQRGRRGWADDDLWGLESYLADLLSGSLRQIAELSFCWNDRVWDTHENWVAELRRIADRCEELSALQENGEETAVLVDEPGPPPGPTWSPSLIPTAGTTTTSGPPTAATPSGGTGRTSSLSMTSAPSTRSRRTVGRAGIPGARRSTAASRLRSSPATATGNPDGSRSPA
jgi:hypothetical protein